jgi:hypothetical protein
MAMDEHDMMAEQQLYPWLDDPSCDPSCDASDEDNYCDESMDGDHDSAMESCGWGTDEDYGYYGGDDE